MQNTLLKTLLIFHFNIFNGFYPVNTLYFWQKTSINSQAYVKNVTRKMGEKL